MRIEGIKTKGGNKKMIVKIIMKGGEKVES